MSLARCSMTVQFLLRKASSLPCQHSHRTPALGCTVTRKLQDAMSEDLEVSLPTGTLSGSSQDPHIHYPCNLPSAFGDQV